MEVEVIDEVDGEGRNAASRWPAPLFAMIEMTATNSRLTFSKVTSQCGLSMWPLNVQCGITNARLLAS